jgi:phosphoribosylamine--glycine ligase
MMKKYNIPSPEYEIFTDASEAKQFVKNMMDKGKQVVVKADGLAAGKGAIVTSTYDEAEKAIDLCLTEKAFGNAGNKIVIEERLSGPEISILAITDGKNIVILPPAQDHKPIGEGDTGLNTGGMGSYSPVPLADDQLIDDVKNNVLMPAIKGMEAEGFPYSGVLYAGLMIHNGKPYVIEFNCRMGDPETQSVLASVEEDLLPVFLNCAKEKLGEDRVIKPAKSTMCVVMTSGGYPEAYENGKVIHGLDTVKQEMDGKAVVFHAGTAKDGDNFITAGGRVLGVTGIGANFDEATKHAYEAVDKISFDGAYYRKDIGYRVRNMG